MKYARLKLPEPIEVFGIVDEDEDVVFKQLAFKIKQWKMVARMAEFNIVIVAIILDTTLSKFQFQWHF